MIEQRLAFFSSIHFSFRFFLSFTPFTSRSGYIESREYNEYEQKKGSKEASSEISLLGSHDTLSYDSRLVGSATPFETQEEHGHCTRSIDPTSTLLIFYLSTLSIVFFFFFFFLFHLFHRLTSFLILYPRHIYTKYLRIFDDLVSFYEDFHFKEKKNTLYNTM